jgi:hypothetical protein
MTSTGNNDAQLANEAPKSTSRTIAGINYNLKTGNLTP